MNIKLKGFALLLSGALSVAAAPVDNVPNTGFRAAAIKEAFRHSWNGYVQHAWGADELRPISNGKGYSRNGWGATIVDALSTAILMDLDDVVMECLEFIPGINFTTTFADVSLFETTIRYLGGLVSAHDLLTGPYVNMVPQNRKSFVDDLIKQAVILADTLKFAFNTKSGIPANDLDIITRSFDDVENGIATIGTLILEWTKLSDITGDQTYTNLTQRGEAPLLRPQPATAEPYPGLITTWWNLETGRGRGDSGGWSAGDDSFYEYLLKMYIYDDKRFAFYGDRWLMAAESTLKYLKSNPLNRSDVTFVSEFGNGQLSRNQGHLTCFIGGNFLLGGHIFGRSDLSQFGRELTDGCHHTYATSPAKIGPERFSWDPARVPADQAEFFRNNGFYITSGSYILRPEVIESYYYAWRLIGEEKYRDWAWDAFVAINRTCRTSSGYASLNDVRQENGGSQLDYQESFWFAETLKYLWLIFDGAKIEDFGVTTGKQKWVFNTEAHPVRVIR